MVQLQRSLREGARLCQTPALVGSEGFPRPTLGSRANSGPRSSPGSLCAWRQDHLKATAQATGHLFCLRSREPAWECSCSRFPQGTGSCALLKPLRFHDPSLTAGWLPSSSSACWQSMNQLSRGLTRRAKPGPKRPALLCQAAPLSRLQTPNPGHGPPAGGKNLLPEDPKLSPKQIYANELLQGPTTHLLGRSPPADPTSIPAGSPASGP